MRFALLLLCSSAIGCSLLEGEEAKSDVVKMSAGELIAEYNKSENLAPFARDTKGAFWRKAVWKTKRLRVSGRVNQAYDSFFLLVESADEDPKEYSDAVYCDFDSRHAEEEKAKTLVEGDLVVVEGRPGTFSEGGIARLNDCTIVEKPHRDASTGKRSSFS